MRISGTIPSRSHVFTASVLCLLTTAPLAMAQNGNHRWSAFVSGRGGLFQTRVVDPAGSGSATDPLSTVDAALAYSRYTRSSLLTVSGWTSNLFVSDFDFANYGASATGYKRFSDKALVRFGTGVSKGFNYNDLIVNGVAFIDQDVVSMYGTTGLAYDFSASTSAFADFSYSRFRFDITQQVDGSQFVFAVPANDDALAPGVPTDPPFSSTTAENVLDASQITASLLAVEGALLSRFTSEIFSLAGGVSHELGASTELAGRAGYRWLQYQRPFLIEGADWFSGLRLAHSFNPKTSASLEYTFRQNQVVAPRVDSHTGFGRVERQVTVPVRIEGSFGVTYVPVRGVEPYTFVLIGGGAVTGEFVRTAFHVDYRHQAQHSLGIGRFLTSDFGSAGVSRVFSRSWFGYGFVGYRFSRGTFDDAFSFGVLVAGADIRYRINEDFSVGASYLFRHLDRDGSRLDTHMLSAVLTFAKLWR